MRKKNGQVRVTSAPEVPYKPVVILYDVTYKNMFFAIVHLSELEDVVLF